MGKKVKIIGSGIAGLSAGCYLQMNGFETEIYELHNIPGGLCTGWERMGYMFDGCIHWLVGSSPANNFYPLWNELIDMRRQKFVNHDIYMRIWDETGKNYIDFFTDVNRLEQELLAKAPEDGHLIRSFTEAIRRMGKLNMPVEKAREVMNTMDAVKVLGKFLPYVGTFRKWGRLSIADFASKFQNPLLKKGVNSLFVPEMSVLFIIMNMAWMSNGAAGYPLGGSLRFAEKIAERYEKLGGILNFNQRVERIMVKDNVATGIKLSSGEEKGSDIVVSAADGFNTIYNMLDGKFRNRKIDGYYDRYKVFPSYLQVSLGLNREMKGIVPSQNIPVTGGLLIDNSTTIDYFHVRIFNFDDSLAPKGKTTITAMIPTVNYRYWVDLKGRDGKKYRNEKKRISDRLTEVLEEKFGNIKKHIEVTDISTPASVIRYTENWKGSLEGWILTPEIGFRHMEKTLPGLKHFYMAGQWVEPGGGLPTALMSGRGVAQIICREDEKKFITKSF